MTVDFLKRLVLRSMTRQFPAVRDDIGELYCGYRAPGGRQCIVGMIIPEAEYTPKMEGGGINCLNDENLFNYDWLPDGVLFGELERLQMLHDGMSTEVSYKTNYQTVIRAWNHEEFMSALRYRFPDLMSQIKVGWEL